MNSSSKASSVGPIPSGQSVNERLVSLGIELPDPFMPIARYAAFRRSGSVVQLSGQGPVLQNGEGIFGKIGRDLTLEDGVKASRITALNMLAQANAICEGDLGRIVQWIKITAYVNCTDDFFDQPAVVDGASNLLYEVFGDVGLAARAAVGVNALPMNTPVEIQAEFEVSV